MRALLDPPPGVDMDVDGRRIALRGQAPADWIQGLPALRDSTPEIEFLDLGGLQLDRETVQAASRKVAAQTVYFAEGVTLSGGGPELNAIADEIKALLAVTGIVGGTVRLAVLGSTDGSGTRSSNVALALDRARQVIDLLAARDVPRNLMRAEVGSLGREGGEEPDPRNRKASFELTVRR